MQINSDNLESAINDLIIYDDAYFNFEPIVPDDVYDALKRDVEKFNPSHPYFKSVGANVRGTEVIHSTPIGGLNQLHEGEVEDWVKKHKSNKVWVVSEKLDGASGILTIQSSKLKVALSRGDGFSGKDITRHVKKLNCIPTQIKTNDLLPSVFEVRGELIIKKEKFAEMQVLLKELRGREYKNARNTVNGLINAKEIEPELLPFIDFVAYDIPGSFLDKDAQLEVLQELGFLTPHMAYIYEDHLSEDQLTNILNNFRETSQYAIDGVVVEINEGEKRKKLMPTADDLNPGYAFKWKVGAEDNIATAEIKDVEWNRTMYDYFKPVGIIDPVELNGVTISRITAFNAKYVVENGIGIGAVIKFTRSGDVIPHILEVVKKVVPLLPNEDWEWTETGVDAVALNESVDAHSLRVKSFFNSLDVEMLQEASIWKFLEEGYLEIADIIDAPIEVWESILGKNGIKAKNSLQERLSSVKLYQLMGAWPYFGRGFGERKAKMLTTSPVALGWVDATVEELEVIDGWGIKTAQQFVRERDSFIVFLDWLSVQGFVGNLALDEDRYEGRFSGQSFAFTGVRLKDREEELKMMGAEIHDGVKKNTTYLVAKDPNKSSNKLDKARQQGTLVISVDELEKLIEV